MKSLEREACHRAAQRVIVADQPKLSRFTAYKRYRAYTDLRKACSRT